MPTREFQLHSSDSVDAQRLAAITALGMCRAISEGLVTAEYACDTLFRPSLVQRLRAIDADESLCQALEKALELEDVAAYAPQSLVSLLDDLTNTLAAFLRGSSVLNSGSYATWSNE